METETAPIKLTTSAISRVRALMDRSDKPVLGLRVGVTSTGCSGHMYQVEYAEDERPLEEVIEQDGVKIYVDPLAMMFIFGSTM